MNKEGRRRSQATHKEVVVVVVEDKEQRGSWTSSANESGEMDEADICR